MKLISLTSTTTSIHTKINNILLCLFFCLLIVHYIPVFYHWLDQIQIGFEKTIVYHKPFRFPFYDFFTDCIETPVYEEFCYRVFPIEVALIAGKYILQERRDKDIMLIFIIIFCSMQFGWGHGGVEYVFIQGLGGLLLSILYLVNGRGWAGYISVMIVHFGINFNADIVYPLLHQ